MSTVTARYRPLTRLTFNPGEAREESVTLALRQVTNPTRVSLIQQQLGLTKGVVVLEGRLVEPLRVPSNVKAGSEALLSWSGRVGVARLEPYQSALTGELRDRFGDKVLLSWRTDEIP